MKSLTKSPSFFPSLLLMVYVFFYYFDVGNLNAIRQGTEALYLNITQEMFERGSLLEPYFHGKITWTKPPMHFWLAYPFHFLFLGPSTFTGRLSTVTLCLSFICFLAFWFKREKKIPWLYTFAFFATSFGFYRYARIYMMEMTMMVFSTVSILSYYTYYKEQKNSWLIVSCLSLAAATLVKGPVTLAMSFMAVGLFHLAELKWEKKKLPWNNIVSFGVLSLFFSSLWFLACYAKYGYEFIDWFFIRENLGKFTSKSYPMTVILEGLLINALPWTLLLYPAVKKFKKEFSENKLALYLLIAFASFFFIWFIPKQRSHHYAIPSLAFFLSFIWTMLANHFQDHTHKWVRNIFYILILIPLAIITFAFLSFWIDQNTSWTIDLGAIIVGLWGIKVIIRDTDFRKKALSLFINFAYLWTIFLPQYFFPLVPHDRVEKLQKVDLRLTVERAYFFKEALGMSKPSLSFYDIPQWLSHKDSYLLIISPDYTLFDVDRYGEVVDRWPKWKRKPSREDIKAAFQNRNIKLLQEEYLLIQGLGKPFP